MTKPEYHAFVLRVDKDKFKRLKRLAENLHMTITALLRLQVDRIIEYDNGELFKTFRKQIFDEVF